MNFNELFTKHGMSFENGCIIKHSCGITVTGGWYDLRLPYRPNEFKTLKEIVRNNFPNMYDAVRDAEGKAGILLLLSEIESRIVI